MWCCVIVLQHNIGVTGPACSVGVVVPQHDINVTGPACNVVVPWHNVGVTGWPWSWGVQLQQQWEGLQFDVMLGRDLICGMGSVLKSGVVQFFGHKPGNWDQDQSLPKANHERPD
ncbi:hypothetical protein EDB86DRAFT_2839465 [Lactarius hatsudake]|nr:hypothetical protein EDB86DRAFT_2839465 [Lactarius hatsudake]